MKKIKAIVAVVVMLCGMLANSSVAWAAETGLTIREGETVVTALTEDEMAALSREIKLGVIGGTVAPSAVLRDSSYSAYQYSKTYEFYNGEEKIAQTDVKCIVWHYTDGKVHLYSRTINISRLDTYDASRYYGRIVNTDGSLSYTTGDSVLIYDFVNRWEYAIDFRITPSSYSFSCYEI